MNNPKQTPKTATTAGALAIVLGAFGMHDWYLGDQKRAKTHVVLTAAGAVVAALAIILRALAKSANNFATVNVMNNIATTLSVIGWLVILANVVWGTIEGILLLIQGDAGLAERGITVNTANSGAKASSSNISEQGAGLADSGNMFEQNANLADTNSQVNANSTPSQGTSRPAGNQPAAVANTALATPTLEQAGANAATSGQPMVFRASDIKRTEPVGMVDQAIGTKDVELPPLTVQKQDGKTTLNPHILRKIVIGVTLVIAVVVGFFLIRGGVTSVINQGYGRTYRLAKELLPKITNAGQSSSCQFAVSYVNAAGVDRSSYDEYINNCKDLATGINNMILELGKTPGMSWNTEISNQYKDFQALYDEAFPEGEEQKTALMQALDLYQIWHNYALAVDLLMVESTEEDFKAAADILRTSGNETLAKYGEEWLQKELEYIAAYKVYWDTSYNDPNKEVLRAELDTRRAELRDWVNDHRPDVTRLKPITVPDAKPMYNSYLRLYDLIKSAYENHYNRDSNDCNMAGQVVYCS